jgi:hypothetical protein
MTAHQLCDETCTYTHVMIHGKEYERVRVRSVGDDLAARGSSTYGFTEEALAEPLCECGCDIGEVHHVGCDLEVCPGCGGQFLMCIEEDTVIKRYKSRK